MYSADVGNRATTPQPQAIKKQETRMIRFQNNYDRTGPHKFAQNNPLFRCVLVGVFLEIAVSAYAYMND